MSTKPVIPRLTFNEPASDENSYDASKAEREFVASKSNDSADETQKSSLAVEDTQRDESSKVDPEKFHAVFGVYPDKLEKEITESAKERPDQKHAEPTWLQNANVHDHSAFVYNQPHVQSVAPQNQKPVQFHQKLGNVLLNVLRGVTMCCYTCYAFCPPIPSVIARKVAFQPPQLPHYHFYVLDENGQKVKVNAKTAMGREIVDIDLEMQVFGGKEPVVDNLSGFVVKTSRNNYLACVQVKCGLKHKPRCLKNKVVLFCQPNSSDLGMFIWQRKISSITLKKITNRLGVDVYTFDYSGFGLSSGIPSEQNLNADIKAVYEHIRKERPGIEIFLMGLSLGTAASIGLASSKPDDLGGVILLAPFTSGMRVMTGNANREKPYKMDAFRSVEKIGLIEVPIFIAHGLLDDVIAYDHGVALLRKAKYPVPIALPGNSDHSDVFTIRVAKRVLKFIAKEADNYSEFHTKEEVMEHLEAELKKIREHNFSKREESAKEKEEKTKELTLSDERLSLSQLSCSATDTDDVGAQGDMELLEQEIHTAESMEAFNEDPDALASMNLTEKVYNHANHLKTQAKLPGSLVATALKSRFSTGEDHLNDIVDSSE